MVGWWDRNTDTHASFFVFAKVMAEITQKYGIQSKQDRLSNANNRSARSVYFCNWFYPSLFPVWDAQLQRLCVRPLLLFRSSWTIEGWTTRIRRLLLNHTQTTVFTIPKVLSSHDHILLSLPFVAAQDGKNLKPHLKSPPACDRHQSPLFRLTAQLSV